MNESRSAPPGWYPHPTMANTQRYWDGEHWTDQVAPAAPRQPSGPGVMTIARGVALGVAVVLVGGVWISSCQAEQERHDCVMENADRAMDGLPLRDCG